MRQIAFIVYATVLLHGVAQAQSISSSRSNGARIGVSGGVSYRTGASYLKNAGQYAALAVAGPIAPGLGLRAQAQVEHFAGRTEPTGAPGDYSVIPDDLFLGGVTVDASIVVPWQKGRCTVFAGPGLYYGMQTPRADHPVSLGADAELDIRVGWHVSIALGYNYVNRDIGATHHAFPIGIRAMW